MSLIGKKQFLLTVLLLLSSCDSGDFRTGNIVSDSDWNTRFLSNCPLPYRDSIRWVSENRRFVRFTLSDNDKGGCITDKVARHRAPYWERAELKQVGVLRKNKSYSINATLRFVEGFSGDRESFFQIHAYDKNCTHAYPPLMLRFDKTHSNPPKLTLAALQKNRHHVNFRSNIHIEDILGDWIDLTLKLEMSAENRSVTVLMDGEALFSDIPFWVDPCGILHIKFGAYRPGSLSGNVKSIVDFDSINVKDLPG